MEPIAAFALVASILQFTDFSMKILAGGRQIYQTGSTVQHLELSLVAKDLNLLNDKITAWARPDATSMGPPSQENQVIAYSEKRNNMRLTEEKALEDLAKESAKVAGELLGVLSKLQLEEGAGKFRSFRQAMLTTWNHAKIEDVAKRLESIRAQLQFRILVSMKSTVDKVALQNDDNLRSLDKATRTIVKSILEGNDDVATIIASQMDEIVKRHDAGELSADQRHQETLAEIKNIPHALSPYLPVNEKIDPQEVLRTIKSRLYFDRMWDRFDDIDPAHTKTFEWLFQDSDHNQTSGTTFSHWLRHGNGLYWISGKAGSGKSTLMKFLKQDWRLSRELGVWADGQPLLIVSFYFWNAGTDLQKSQDGLFRSIISEALTQKPELGPILFSDRYQLGASWLEFPTFHQLRRAFMKLSTQAEVPIKLGLLIDGLDEFEPTRATMTELADIFIEATKSTRVKAVVSSRPLPAFEAAFATHPKLRVHDLTYKDIRTYVDDNLGRHPRIVELSEDDAPGTEALVSEISESASGVFLWVKLVVYSLLEGLQNYDLLSDLQERLRQLPPDLENLFMHMLRKIPPEYKSRSSRIFQILRSHELAEQQSSNNQYPSINNQYATLTAIGLHYTEFALETVLKAKVEELSAVEKKRRRNEVDGRLRSHCAGLLQLRESASHCRSAGEEYDDVQYLHKTVADFFQKELVWEKILEATRGTKFDPFVSSLQSIVMMLKCSPPRPVNGPEDSTAKIYPMGLRWNLVNCAMRFAKLAEKSTGRAQEDILDELNNSMSTHFKMTRDIYSHRGVPDSWLLSADISSRSYRLQEDDRPWFACHNTFLTFTIQHGLTLYVQSKLRRHGQCLPRKHGRPLLDYACRPVSNWTYGISPAIVQTLLEHGADPNEKFKSFSPWQNAVYTPVPDLRRWLAVLKLLLLHGADPNAYIEEKQKGVGTHAGTWEGLPRYHHRQSVLLVLQEYLLTHPPQHFSNYFGPYDPQLGSPLIDQLPQNVRDEVLELIECLEQKGAKAEEYYLEEREPPAVVEDRVVDDKQEVVLKSSESTAKVEDAQAHIENTKRAKRFLRRLFKRTR